MNGRKDAFDKIKIIENLIFVLYILLHKVVKSDGNYQNDTLLFLIFNFNCKLIDEKDPSV
jgi:hypothetical protein